MAQYVVKTQEVSVRQACQILGISERGYRYKPVLRWENRQIADWLIRITDSQKIGDFDYATCIYAM